MPFEVFVTGAEKVFPCREYQSVLAAMSLSGASCVQVGCRSGGCGVCRVEVLSGAFETGQMSQAQVCDADREKGIALACQLFPRGDLRVRVLGRSNASVGDPAADLIRRLTASASRVATLSAA